MALTAILLFVSCSPDKNNNLLYSSDQPNRTVNFTREITGYRHFSFVDYNTDEIIRMISQNKPVIAQGYTIEDKGHYYIIEAIQMQYQEQFTIAGNQEVRMGYCASHAILTCNMGWGDKSQHYLLPCNTNDSVDSIRPLTFRYNAHSSHY